MNFSDLDQVVRLYRDANLFAKKKDIYDWTRKGLKKYPNFNLVCIQNGEVEVIGAISAILQNSEKAVINDIAVQKKYRGKTIGSKLMNKLVEVIKKENVKKIALWVHWSNAAAIPFYYRFGFRIKKCMRTKGMSGVPDGEATIHLEKFI